MTIEYETLKQRVCSLNSDITFDETNLFRYPDDAGGRTGIMYRGRHICNTSRNLLREYDEVGNSQTFQVLATPHEALLYHNKVSGNYHTYKFLIQDCDGPLWHEAVLRLNGKDVVETTLGGEPVLLESRIGEDMLGAKHLVVLCRIYFKQTDMPSKIVRIGWRSVLNHLGGSKIPGITKASLEREFGVVGI